MIFEALVKDVSINQPHHDRRGREDGGAHDDRLAGDAAVPMWDLAHEHGQLRTREVGDHSRALTMWKQYRRQVA